jgi:hypothetical protein
VNKVASDKDTNRAHNRRHKEADRSEAKALFQGLLEMRCQESDQRDPVQEMQGLRPETEEQIGGPKEVAV